MLQAKRGNIYLLDELLRRGIVFIPYIAILFIFGEASLVDYNLALVSIQPISIISTSVVVPLVINQKLIFEFKGFIYLIFLLLSLSSLLLVFPSPLFQAFDIFLISFIPIKTVFKSYSEQHLLLRDGVLKSIKLNICLFLTQLLFSLAILIADIHSLSYYLMVFPLEVAIIFGFISRAKFQGRIIQLSDIRNSSILLLGKGFSSFLDSFVLRTIGSVYSGNIVLLLSIYLRFAELISGIIIYPRLNFYLKFNKLSLLNHFRVILVKGLIQKRFIYTAILFVILISSNLLIGDYLRNKFSFLSQFSVPVFFLLIVLIAFQQSISFFIKRILTYKVQFVIEVSRNIAGSLVLILFFLNFKFPTLLYVNYIVLQVIATYFLFIYYHEKTRNIYR